MSNFTTKQEVLFYCYTLNEKQRKKIDEFLQLLNESGVSEVIQSSITNHNIGRPGFNPYAIFATVIYGFAVGTPTLRELESSCRYDLRFIYLMGGETPTYATFANYINKVIAPQADLIFDYWKAPEKIKPETFKKPSAKRLVNRALKKRMKQPNEIARESYKYKKSG